MMPSSTSGWPNLALVDAKRRSQARASSQPAAEGVAADRGDHHAGDGGDGVEGLDEVAADAGRLDRAAELGDLGAGREDAVAAGDHDGPGRIGLQALGHRLQLAQQRGGERVDLRVVQGDDGHAVVPSFEEHELLGCGVAGCLFVSHGARSYPVAPGRGRPTRSIAGHGSGRAARLGRTT